MHLILPCWKLLTFGLIKALKIRREAEAASKSFRPLGEDTFNVCNNVKYFLHGVCHTFIV